MTPRLAAIAMVPILVSLGVAPARAQPRGSAAILYRLEASSTFQWGCFDLCACPIVTSPLEGTFVLERLQPDPLFEHYRVSEVAWRTHGASGDTRITGSGTYDVGGEVAVQQRMTLDLTVDSLPARTFDSGVVAGGGEFPTIHIRVRLHQSPSCTDTVIDLHASPSVANVALAGAGWPYALPNPFIVGVRVGFVVSEDGAVDVGVHDLTGRLVRKIADGMWLEAGSHALEWDGRNADGRAVPSGLYFIRVRSVGREGVCTIVKLR